MKKLVFIVVPSLKITGGTKEIVTLSRDIVAAGGEARVIAMWRTPDEISCHPLPVDYLSSAAISPKQVIAGMPRVLARFLKIKKHHRDAQWMLSHYVTYALAPFIGGNKLWFFVQDLEWTFAPLRFRGILRRLILSTLTRGRTLAANSYLASALSQHGVRVAATIPIWASPDFQGALDGRRDIDIILVMRRGAHKRVDIAERILRLKRESHPHLRMAVITPNDEFADAFRGDASVDILLRPTVGEMRAIYERTRVFLLLSEHEGFGLPPLEAMGAGCVPLCRDAGGVRAYMRGELAENILPLALPAEDILKHAMALAHDESCLARLRMTARKIFDDGLERVAQRPSDLSASGIL